MDRLSQRGPGISVSTASPNVHRRRERDGQRGGRPLGSRARRPCTPRSPCQKRVMRGRMTAKAAITPSVHFSDAEFTDRRTRACQALADQHLDGILISKIEDQYWLTGLDTDGFCI